MRAPPLSAEAHAADGEGWSLDCGGHEFNVWIGGRGSRLAGLVDARGVTRPGSRHRIRSAVNPHPATGGPHVARTSRSVTLWVCRHERLVVRPRGRAAGQCVWLSPGELAAIPDEANLGLSCGNPTAFASLKPGETVVDPLRRASTCSCSQTVGRAIGIDMTPQMIELAKKNAARCDNGKPLKNVEFHLATIDKLPLPDASVDVVISNCVINLAADKRAVFREIARVLRPGRVAPSDILKQPLPRNSAATGGHTAARRAILIDECAGWPLLDWPTWT
jgi:SAM-dependent methyltransferase